MAASAGPRSLPELDRQPCLALDVGQTAKLGVILEPSETDVGARSCQWWTRDGLVSFTAYPLSDETARADLRQLTGPTIAGHRAVLGTTHRGGCTMYAVVGSQQSLRLLSSPAAKAVEECGLNTQFATAILARLG